MIVLHAALRGEALQVWGERPRREDPALRPPTRGVAASAEASPYDAGADALASALRAAGLATPLPPVSVTLWLPTVKGAPVPSSPLIAEPPAGAPALRPWTLTACTFAPPRPPLSGRVHRPRVAGRRRVRRQGPGVCGGGAPVRGRPRRPPSGSCRAWRRAGRPSRRLAAGDRGRGRRAVHPSPARCPRPAAPWSRTGLRLPPPPPRPCSGPSSRPSSITSPARRTVSRRSRRATARSTASTINGSTPSARRTGPCSPRPRSWRASSARSRSGTVRPPSPPPRPSG
jgi:hypothetical protein